MYIQHVPKNHPELIGTAPEVYFERVPPNAGLNQQSLQAARQLVDPSGQVRVLTIPDMADSARSIIKQSGAEIVSEGAVEVTTDVATTVGYEFMLRYK